MSALAGCASSDASRAQAPPGTGESPFGADFVPRRVAVFRALVLGDMLCAVPALRAFKAAWPHCELTLIGLPWAAALAQRLPMVDRFIAFPGHPGMPETAAQLPALPDFLRRMQAESFDLLVQLHGSGTITNPLMAACGARHVAGFVEPAGYAPDPAGFVPWPTHGHEIERLLHLVDHLGLPRRGTALAFPLNDGDRIELAGLWPGAYGTQPFVCVHPGAQLPSRRWPPERFAEVADALAARGFTIVLTGTPGESDLVAAARRAMRHEAVDLAGRTSLWTLGALVERARLVVCNDTGISHVAAALNTPSVVVSCGADVTRWAPLDRAQHPVLWHLTPCRPCNFAECPYAEHPCARGVTAAMVAQAAQAIDSLNAAHA